METVGGCTPGESFRCGCLLRFLVLLFDWETAVTVSKALGRQVNTVAKKSTIGFQGLFSLFFYFLQYDALMFRFGIYVQNK